MARLAAYVHVVSPQGASCAFGPDDDVPDWAAEQITNPKAWAEAPEQASATTPVVEDLHDASLEAGEGYAGMKVADLKAEIENRNAGREDDALLSVDGKKADLVAVLEADDQSV